MIMRPTAKTTLRPEDVEVAARPRLPLYLYGRNATHIVLDGPALKVQRHGKADIRYPLSRLSRIISGLDVKWQTQALKACIDERLPIVFVSRDGQPAAYLYPVQRTPSRLDALLEELFDRPDGIVHYTHWLRAERMRILYTWRQRKLARGQPIEPLEYSELVRRYVYLGEPPMIAAGEIFHSALFAYALQQIQAAGARTVYWGAGAKPLNLVSDLSGLLLLALALELQGLVTHWHGDDKTMLTVLHTQLPLLTDLGRAALSRLHRRIQQLLEEWR